MEGALGGKKSEFEKWNNEIKRREETGGGGNGGRGGWFGWGGQFGWSNGDHFWQEAQQMGLTILSIVCMVSVSLKPLSVSKLSSFGFLCNKGLFMGFMWDSEAARS